MMCGISEIDKDGFGMTYMKISIGFWWEPSPYLSTSGGEVGFTKGRMDLGVFAWFVKLTKEAFLKD